jgi:hypothetical protein
MELEEIEKRVLATSEDWRCTVEDVFDENGGEWYASGPLRGDEEQACKDREFIQHARADVLVLIAVVRELNGLLTAALKERNVARAEEDGSLHAYMAAELAAEPQEAYLRASAMLKKAEQDRDDVRVQGERLAKALNMALAEKEALFRAYTVAKIEAADQRGAYLQFSDLLKVAERERDEAREEAERAKADVAALELGIAAQDEVLTRRYNDQLAKAKDAYRRGAEAMRKACAEAMRPMLRSMVSRTEAAETIRNLMIPEEP